MYVAHTVVSYGSINDWEFLLNEYVKEKDLKMKIILQDALSKTRDMNLLERFLNYQLNETIVNRQDCLNGISYAVENIYGYYFTWNFVKKNWNKLYEKYKSKIIILIFCLLIIYSNILSLKISS
jgi:hypothetical protein